MTTKRTITTTSCQFQLRLPWALREEIEAQLEDGESLGGWIKYACELRLSGKKNKKNKTQERTVPNAANERRVAETKDKIEQVITGMDSEEKTQLLAERYPKARFSEISGLSKDSVRRYWDEIEQLLNER
ncbi:hypothetical protein LQN34_003651 [Vibrio cholerae]|nr:hypothetical protein [Vibrio cholerae]